MVLEMLSLELAPTEAWAVHFFIVS